MIVGWDWDGTLVESWTATPLFGVRLRLTMLPKDTKTFIATNQAGPVFRQMLSDPKYPTCEDVAERIIAGLAALDWRPDALFIATCADPEPDYIWRIAAQEACVRLYDLLQHVCYCSVSAIPLDRKPSGGMLIDAAEYFQAPPRELRYIGDMDTDHQAALAAGCHYLDAATWRDAAHDAAWREEPLR